MSVYQKIVSGFVYPLDRWRTGDAAELRYLREFEQSQFWPAAEVRQNAWHRLTEQLDHAYRRCPYYRKVFDAVGICPSDIRSPDDLAAIPVLDKRDLQSHRDEMIAKDWPTRDLVMDQTGGSTGRPISYFLSRDRIRSRQAAAWRHNRWAGWDIGDKVALVWGSPPTTPEKGWKKLARNLLIDRRMFLNAGHLTEDALRSFSHSIKQFRPKVVLAYARSMALLARYIRDHQMQAYQPKSIVTSAEVLSDVERALIEDVFGCPVFNRYGCREVSVVASECSQHSGLHIMAEGLYVEVVRDGRQARVGELGAVLVTDLLNLAMPLIRYRIGDLAIQDDTPCPCGRGLPRLRSVEGRVTDFLVGVDGRLVSGVYLATYVLALRPSLGEVQLWQELPGQVLYKIVRRSVDSPLANEDIQFLITETKRHLGDATIVDYELVDELTTGGSGKFLFCRSTATSDCIGNGGAA